MLRCNAQTDLCPSVFWHQLTKSCLTLVHKLMCLVFTGHRNVVLRKCDVTSFSWRAWNECHVRVICCVTMKMTNKMHFFSFFAATQRGSWPHSWVFLDRTERRTTVGRTPLGEWSARRRDLYTWQHTTLTTDKHPCPRWDSNPRSQQASGRRPMNKMHYID